MARKCVIWWDNKLQGYHVQTPYHPQFVEFLKVAVPASDRSYEPVNKTWLFAEKYLDPIKGAAEKFFGQAEVTIVTKQQASASAQAPAKAQTIDQVMLEFMRLLPFEAAQKAFRAGAMALHPDRGGSMEAMAKLNTLWDRLEKEHYKP